MDVGRILFLMVAFATHGAVGYSLVCGFTDVNPRIGFVLALVPDIDFLFPAALDAPFVHRGLTHTPAFTLTIVVAAYSIRRSKGVAIAVWLAIGSHLAIDSLSPAGIPWLFPFETSMSADLPVHGPIGTLLLWALAIGILVWRT